MARIGLLNHDTPVRYVSVEPAALTADAWEPFGWLPVPDTDPHDAEHLLHFEWADPNLNVIAHEYDEVEHDDGGTVCAVMYRHDTHTQALMPLNVPAVIAVAPSSVEFTAEGDQESIRVFRMEPLESLVLHLGTWHWGPFPIEAPEVRLFNVQGLRYAEDNRCMDLAALGLCVDVDLKSRPT